MKRFIGFAEWLWELLVLQGIWLLYILKGFILLGLFPSTTAVYAVVRTWIRKQTEESTVVLFRQYYKEHFRQANMLGWSFLVISAIIFINFMFIPMYGFDWLRVGMYGLLIFMSFIMLTLWVFLFPVLVHFEIKKSTSYALVMVKTALMAPSGLILQLLFSGVYTMLVYFLPPLIIVFGIIPLALIQMAVTLNIYRDNNSKIINKDSN